MNTNELRKAAKCIFLECPEPVAKDLSNKLIWAADEIDKNQSEEKNIYTCNIEVLAAYAHNAWSGWMVYLFGKSKKNEDGTVTIPMWAVERWERQASSKYNQLPEEEKASDRKEAKEILCTLN